MAIHVDSRLCLLSASASMRRKFDPMKYIWLLFLIGLGSWACFGQTSKQYRACSQKAKTQAEMDACANEEAQRVDTELNRIYNDLLLKAKADPSALTKIRAAEHAWIVYRDAYVDAMYPAKDKQAEYGSMFPMEVNLLKAELTRQHIAALEEMLKRYGGTAGG